MKELFASTGITKADLNICFDTCYIPAFSWGWWLVTVSSMSIALAGGFGLYVLLWAVWR